MTATDAEPYRSEFDEFQEIVQRGERAERERAAKAAAEKAEREAKEALRTAELTRRKAMLPFSEDLAVEICERVSAGELLIDICENDARMPTVRRCQQWQKQNPDFFSLYKESINDRLDIFVEQVLRIADDVSSDWKEVNS